MQQLGSLVLLLSPPPFKAAHRHDICRNALVVKRVDSIVVGDDIAPAAALLKLFKFATQLPVCAVEGLRRIPVALDECVPNEELACVFCVNSRELNAATLDERHAKERDALVRDGRALRFLPVRFRDLPFGERACEFFGPCRVHDRVAAREQPRGLDEFDTHDKLRRRFREHRSGEEYEARAARPDVLLGFLAL